jgi:hypothetical protein
MFGWVKATRDEDRSARVAYAGRVRFSHATLTEDGDKGVYNEELPLAILGSPKPTTTLFYLRKEKGEWSDDERKKPGAVTTIGYDGPNELRGRKVFRHPRRRAQPPGVRTRRTASRPSEPQRARGAGAGQRLRVRNRLPQPGAGGTGRAAVDVELEQRRVRLSPGLRQATGIWQRQDRGGQGRTAGHRTALSISGRVGMAHCPAVPAQRLAGALRAGRCKVVTGVPCAIWTTFEI